MMHFACKLPCALGPSQILNPTLTRNAAMLCCCSNLRSELPQAVIPQRSACDNTECTICKQCVSVIDASKSASALCNSGLQGVTFPTTAQRTGSLLNLATGGCCGAVEQCLEVNHTPMPGASGPVPRCCHHVLACVAVAPKTVTIQRHYA